MNLAREYSYISTVARTFWRLRHIKRDGPRTFVDVIEEQANRIELPAFARPLFWFDADAASYKPLTHAAYADIVSGRVKL